jgi:hypothetical protein
MTDYRKYTIPFKPSKMTLGIFITMCSLTLFYENKLKNQ